MLISTKASRGEPDTTSLVLRGVAYVALLASVVALLIADFRGEFDDVIHLRAELVSVGDGFQPGAEVKFRGKTVGEVTEVVPGELIEASLSIDRESAQVIPSTVKARVLPGTLFGNTFLELVGPGGDRGDSEALSSGQVLQADRTRRAYELQDALNSVSRVMAAASPAQIDAILSATADSLRGRGEDLGRMVVRLDGYLEAVLDHLPALENDIVLLARAVRILDGAAPDLLAAVRASLKTVATLREAEPELLGLIDGGTRVVETGAAFLEVNEESIVRLVQSLATLLNVVNNHRATLGPTITNVEQTLERWADIMEGAHALPLAGYLGGLVNSGYTSADCPRYPGLDGPNCGQSDDASAPAREQGPGSQAADDPVPGGGDSAVDQAVTDLLDDLDHVLGGLLGGGR